MNTTYYLSVEDANKIFYLDFTEDLDESEYDHVEVITEYNEVSGEEIITGVYGVQVGGNAADDLLYTSIAELYKVKEKAYQIEGE